MEKESIILTKSFDFGVRIFNLYKWLLEKHKIYSVADQILRSGTSIGANVEEATGGFSKKEFAAKIGIAYKEARETKYWLRILYAGGCLEDKQFQSLFSDCKELVKILSSIQMTTRQNILKEQKKSKE
jgi:four helix bundle protein